MNCGNINPKLTSQSSKQIDTHSRPSVCVKTDFILSPPACFNPEAFYDLYPKIRLWNKGQGLLGLYLKVVQKGFKVNNGCIRTVEGFQSKVDLSKEKRCFKTNSALVTYTRFEFRVQGSCRFLNLYHSRPFVGFHHKPSHETLKPRP